MVRSQLKYVTYIQQWTQAAAGDNQLFENISKSLPPMAGK